MRSCPWYSFRSVDAHDDQAGIGALRDLQNLICGGTLFHDEVRRAPKVGLVWDQRAELTFAGFPKFRRTRQVMRGAIFDDMQKCELGLMLLGQGNGEWSGRERCRAKISGVENSRDLSMNDVLSQRSRPDGKNRATSVAGELLQPASLEGPCRFRFCLGCR